MQNKYTAKMSIPCEVLFHNPNGMNLPLETIRDCFKVNKDWAGVMNILCEDFISKTFKKYEKVTGVDIRKNNTCFNLINFQKLLEGYTKFEKNPSHDLLKRLFHLNIIKKNWYHNASDDSIIKTYHVLLNIQSWLQVESLSITKDSDLIMLLRIVNVNHIYRFLDMCFNKNIYTITKNKKFVDVIQEKGLAAIQDITSNMKENELMNKTDYRFVVIGSMRMIRYTLRTVKNY